jgi:hypothetical protein
MLFPSKFPLKEKHFNTYLHIFKKTYKIIQKSTLQLMKWNQGHKVTIYIYILWAPSQKKELVYIQSLFTLWFMHLVGVQSTYTTLEYYK